MNREFAVRPPAQHQEGPSRSCSATKSHGAARQLTMGTASLAYINHPALLFFHVMLLCTQGVPTPATHPQVQYHRQTQREQSAASPLVKRVSCTRYLHTPLQRATGTYTPKRLQPWRSLFLAAAYMYVRELVHTTTYALCVFTRPCQLQLLLRRCRGDAPAHLHPRHPTSRITQLHLASRGISPIRAARRALPWPTRPPAALWHLVQGLGICLLLSLPDDCTCRRYGASPSQYRIARFTTNADRQL